MGESLRLEVGDEVVSHGNRRLKVTRVDDGRIHWREIGTGAVGTAYIQSFESRVAAISKRADSTERP